jgi:hypothetical protein
LSRPQVEHDLDQEVRAHLDLLIDHHTANGLSDPMARRAAYLQLGAVDQIKEAVRDARRGVWFEQSWQDVRYALHMLRNTPTFTAVVMATLALGIGASTAVFSAIHALLLQPLPYPAPERLVFVVQTGLTI